MIMNARGLLTGLFCAAVTVCPGRGQAGTFYSNAVLRDKPVAYWSFDEADGNALQQAPLVVRPITTENDLVPVGGAARVSHASIEGGLARLGNAAQFSGSNFFRANAMRAGKPELSGAYAVEFWMQVLGGNSAERADYLVQFSGNSPAVIYDFKPNQLEFYAGSRTDNGPTVEDGAWHHVVLVYYGDGTDGVEDRVDAYLDGLESPQIGNGFSRRLDLNQIIVGAANLAGANGFEGRLDELAVYDLGSLADSAAVSAKVTSLVTRHMAASTGGQESYGAVVKADQPLLYWSFDESEGNAAQQMPIAAPPLDNSRNELEPQLGAARITHDAAGSGLQLGGAIDLNGQGEYFGRPGGLDLGLPSIPGPWAVEFWFQLKGGQSGRYFLNLGSARVDLNSPAIIYGYFGSSIEVYGAGNGRSGANGVPVGDRNWHHLLVVNYNSGPGGSVSGSGQNRVDFYIDNVLYANVGGDFSKAMDLTGQLLFGGAVLNPNPAQSGSINARLDELALYDLGGLGTVEAVGTRAREMAASHYAAGFGGESVGTITVTGQPSRVSAEVGQPATFTVAATVTGTSSPLAFQWQRNEVSIDGATNSTLLIPATSINDIGTNQYRVRISAGPVFKFSDPADLVVAMPATRPPTRYATEVLKDRPLLYWNFDEFVGDARQLAPISVVPVTSENDLVPTGAAQLRVSHSELASGLVNLGRAVVLDGASFLHAANPRLARRVVTNAYAVEAWVRLDGGPNEYIANFGPAGGDNNPALIHNFTQPGHLELYGEGGRVGAAAVQVTDTAWHHLLWVVYNNGAAGSPNRVDIYWDGVAKENVGNGFNRNLDLRGVLVGAALPGGQNAMAGAIDEFAAYDFAGMTVAEVTGKAAAIATNHFAAARGAGVNYTQVVLADRPVLYYNFEEEAGNAVQRAPVVIAPPDNSANTLVNGGARRVEHSVAGSGLGLGNAADFNGVSYFRAAAPQLPTASLGAPWAVEFWFQVQGANEDNRQDYLLNFDNAPAFIFDFIPNELEMFAGGRTQGGPVVADTQWHHVMWVYYGNGTAGVADRADAYLDGTLIPGIRNSFNARLGLSNPLVVGAARPGYNGFQGRMDELALYDLGALDSESAVTTRVSAMVAGHLAAARAVVPVLAASRVGNQLTLSWSGPGFVLQRSDSPTTASGWQDVPNGGASPVVLTIDESANRFFRLVLP